MGPKSDGGYVVCKEHSQQLSNVVSLGVENNIDFEIDFDQKFKPRRILLYDHTIQELPKKTKFLFTPKGISTKKSKNFLTLADMTRNFEDNKNLLKMDIEYDEWKVFEKANVADLKKFSQIVCEFHFFFLDIHDVNSQKNLTPYFESFSVNNYNKVNDLLKKRYEKVLKKIMEYFVPFHLSANNSLPLKKIFGKKIPQLLEISFLRKDLVKKTKPFLKKLPVKGLDFPNKPYRKELVSFYPFT